MASIKYAKLLEVILVKFLSKLSIHPADPPQAINHMTTVDN